MVNGIFHNEFDFISNSHFIRFSSILICNTDSVSKYWQNISFPVWITYFASDSKFRENTNN